MDGLFEPHSAEIATPATSAPDVADDLAAAAIADAIADDIRRQPAPADAGHATTIHLEIKLESANGHADAIGYFIQGKAGRPAFGQIIWARAGNVPGSETVHIDLDGTDPEDVGLFLLETAAERNPGLADGMFVHFEHSRDRRMVVVGDGRRLTGSIALSDRLDFAAASGAEGQSIGFIGEGQRHASLSARAGGSWPMEGAVRPWI